MAKRILVPLRGRDRDEAVLPVIEAIGRVSGATVRLLRVFPVPEIIEADNGRVVAYIDQEMARLSGQGLVDLETAEVRLDGVAVESVVRFGEPREEILLEAEAFSADLIVLTAARGGRLRRAVFPGVAERVADTAAVPTLLLRV